MIFFLTATAVFGQTIPDELAIAKAKFLKKAETIGEDVPSDLNKKYADGVEALREKKQTAGDLETVLALVEELKAVEETAAPGKTKVAAESDLGRMRKIYGEALMKWNNGQVDAFEKLKLKYIAELAALNAELAKKSRVEDAQMVREEATAVQEMTLAEMRDASIAPEPVGNVGGKRAGQVRGFGRTAKTSWRPEWKDLDLTPLHQYTDFVDVTGSQYHLLFRRANGDVLDRDGKRIGQNAVKLITAASQAGYVDAEGKYYKLFDGDVPAEVQPMKAMVKNNFRRMGITKGGGLISWGGQYKSGERTIPESARENIKQVAMFYDDDFALTDSGELFRWNQNKVVTMKPEISSGIEKFSISQHHGLILTKENDLYFLNGAICPFWPKKAKNVLSRQQLTAVLDMENRWHVFAYNKTPRGNELEVLAVVLNRPETIDAEFILHNSQHNNAGTASYAVWIEEPGTAEIDVINTTSLPKTTTTQRTSGAGFFGTEIE